ncbi:Oligopeptide/dipeptide transporter domain family protein [Synechococcus sp. PCC 7335]|uniref:ABC transporter ATP-binding protein n=1 Tax=Synechococcus sp. (strain ATCC 29403 / PCC 7335) TaxID=91464 RepID=UPI00017ED8DA|nr:ABC transporter ATP-binding protein [Synechococcus sp. PCC 7335]EDX84514.1 Oligopeptide/dipeptide transporter domain family protein [Synechococcus sp. PCC 7335]
MKDNPQVAQFSQYKVDSLTGETVSSDGMSLLSVRNLSLEFRTRTGTVNALENISLQVYPSETVGIVGESGSGKSVLALAIMGILDPAAHITSGEVLWQQSDTYDLLKTSEKELRRLRGKALSMIFQSPRTALNPIRKVGKQIVDVLRAHTTLSRTQLKPRALELLASVRIPDPRQRYNAYPYELSGGLCQRVMIALAIACSPQLLIADEPTTGLDVTTQATVMTLLKELATAKRMATIVITHDLALASEYCDRILVMHAGHLVESAPTHMLFRSPAHPYTTKLIAATPEPHKGFNDLVPILGDLPDLRRADLPPCRFISRCDRATDQCFSAPLLEQQITQDHQVACWHPLEIDTT